MPRNRLLTLAAGAAALIALTACTSDKHAAAGPTGASSSAATGSASAPASGTASASAPASAAASGTAAPVVQNSLPPAASILNDTAKRKSVAITACAGVAGGWAASGTATNSTTKSVKYDITIFFTNDKATVEDFATTSVTVKADGNEKWTASKQFAAAATTRCVLRGVG